MRKKRDHPPFANDKSPPRFWQVRLYDFNVYIARAGKKEKLNYMHANPLLRKLIKHPREWPWSSWGFYFGKQRNLVEMDGIGQGTAKGKTQVPKCQNLGHPALREG